MDAATPLRPKPSEDTLASLLQLDPTPMDSPTTEMDSPLPGAPTGSDPEKARLEPVDAEAMPHRGTTGPISFRTLNPLPALPSDRPRAEPGT